MNLEKIIIKNFKSIDHLEIKCQKYWGSYTTMLLWINESWKSNILEAISFFCRPEWDFDYEEYCNQKNNEESHYVDLFYSLSFSNQKTCLQEFKKLEWIEIEWWDLLNFSIENLEKNIFLEKWEKKFQEIYNYNVVNLVENLFFKETQEYKTVNWSSGYVKVWSFSKNQDEWSTYTKMNNNSFKEKFWKYIDSIVKKFEPSVSVWTPWEDKYLLWSSIDLNSFKNDILSNVPLKNIFAICWYVGSKAIKEKIDSIKNDQIRRTLSTKFSEELTKYVKSIWNHNIIFDIEFTDSMKFNLSIKDGGKDNEHQYYKISSRSLWFKHFLSLILSLSVETKKLWRNNRIIIIDEPEVHLHPSWIRDLRDELLSMWYKNYLFVATHSPFLVDKNDKERNILVKKNMKAQSEIFPIRVDSSLLDDEVLNIAFGIDVYKDLLLPKKILVEGCSDKMILNKIFEVQKIKDCGIANGNWSNIIQIASKYNDDQIDIIVLLDSDKQWVSYKEKIIQVWWVFDEQNVFTIKDIVGTIKDWATIEDLLPKKYIEQQVKQVFSANDKAGDFELDEEKPFIDQIKKYFSISKTEKEKLDILKKRISENYVPTKKAIDDNSVISKFIHNLKEKL